MHNLHGTKQTLTLKSGKEYVYYSLPKLAEKGFNLKKLPICIRIILESVLRNYDNKKITEKHINELANWEANSQRNNEIPFVVARVILQDFTGIPLLCDLAAMRNVAKELNKDPKIIEPLIPIDLVVDHSIQVDVYGNNNALNENMIIEFERNKERYQFLKWGTQAFNTFKVIPPGIGIVHQVNLEYLFKGLQQKDNILFPDTLVGTDSHTTMINGLGVVAWGVGGIEAEAAMLGQPVYFLTPDVVGVELENKLPEGTTATDLVLTITNLLRKEKVVGKFVEFYGSGASALTATDRTTISNMSPEYGATIGFFPPDENTIKYMQNTGKSTEEIEIFEKYFKLQELFGMPKSGEITYSKTIKLDLNSIKPSIAGPKRPQDIIELSSTKSKFTNLFSATIAEGGFNKNPQDLDRSYKSTSKVNNENTTLKHGDILIAAITSCTNTSNPFVLVGAGLLAKKAVAKGLTTNPKIKTSLAPGSRVVTEYLQKAGLQEYLDKLGFNLVGYGCTTCIGNSGELKKEINENIAENDIIACAILSGNRNFEARIQPSIKANFLASPPLVVAYAIAGTMLIDLATEPLGKDTNGNDVYLKDIWPTTSEIDELLQLAQDPKVYNEIYSNNTNSHWEKLSNLTGNVYSWPESTYIAKPPFFSNFNLSYDAVTDIKNAKALCVFGDSVTTDHISPAGSFKANSPAGQYLTNLNIQPKDFNSYGSRRGNHEIMMRGTFANVRIKNLMLKPNPDGTQIEGGFTIYDGEQISIYDAAMKYQTKNTPTIIFAGEEYGTGSSRDWAAKGTLLLGVKAVIAKSFERIHRSNLVGMGVLPLQFKDNDSIESLKITGFETYDIIGINDSIKPQQMLKLVISYSDGNKKEIDLICRIDTPIEVDYYKNGGILPFVLRNLITN